MTFAQLKASTWNALAENASAPLVWTDDLLGRVLNEALSFFALLTGRPQGSASLTLTPGRTVVAVPANVLQVLELRISGKLLTRGDIHALETKRPGWLGESPGLPREWFPIGRFRVGLFPRPDAAYTLAFRGVLQPTDLAAAGDVPPLPVEDHEALVRYATYYGLLLGNDADLERGLAIYGVPNQDGSIPPGSFMHYVSKAMTDQGMVQAVLGSEVRR